MEEACCIFRGGEFGRKAARVVGTILGRFDMVEDEPIFPFLEESVGLVNLLLNELTLGASFAESPDTGERIGVYFQA